MAVAASSKPRVSVGGKFFRLGESKFHVKGLTYGPFAQDAGGSCFPPLEQTRRDLAQICQFGANVIRVYQVPPKWLLELALEHGLRLLVDIPWNKHLCFTESANQREEARQAIRRAVSECAGHGAIFAWSVANEIPSDIVRWSGARAIADFLDELIQLANSLDPECLCTFSNFPPTEFLQVQCVDFVCFNVYLHQRAAFNNYLAKLHMLAESKPLLLGETGLDSLREGEARKAELLAWQVEDSFRAGLAGTIVFSFTDDWWRGGCQVEDWAMGITTRDRTPKESSAAVARAFRAAPYFPLPRYPKVSVIVCSYNAGRTLAACLDSLERLNYPEYEIILVDDGSTDETPRIASTHPKVQYVQHERNLGLSAARNTGLAAAAGEIVAFTDADCRADEDWLYFLVADLLSGSFAAMGGPNLFPPEDSAVAAAVMVSPGGPAHVMLTDRQAEHIPGCNMAFFRAALEEIGGFDPIFRAAGDDVDICWRLQQAGYKIGFSPAAFVWHYRRSTVRDYLKQQHGYGEAEALLVRKHPEYFNSLGGGIWRGRIYAAAPFAVRLRAPIIYRGLFGSAGYQSLYSAEPALNLMVCTTLEYHVLVTLPLWIISGVFYHALPLAITSTALSLAVCAMAGSQATLPRAKVRPWSRPLVALLFFLQPIVRGWARHQGRVLPQTAPANARQTLDSIALLHSGKPLDQVDYWSAAPLDRLTYVKEFLLRLEASGRLFKADIGWSDYDAEIYGGRWTQLQFATVAEEHAQGRRLLRCRLTPRWSLQARIIFWVLVAGELLLLGISGAQWHWLDLLLVLVPLFAWFLHRQGRNLQSMIYVLLDELARELNLTRMSQSPEA